MTPFVRIRDATIHETAALRDVDRRAAGVASGERHTLRADLGTLGVTPGFGGAGHVRVAAGATGRVLGFVVWREFDDAAAEVEHLAVDRDAVGQGIAVALVDDIAECVRRAGRAKLCVIAHPGAFTLFTATGFELMGETHAPFGSALALLRDLDCHEVVSEEHEPELLEAGLAR